MPRGREIALRDISVRRRRLVSSMPVSVVTHGGAWYKVAVPSRLNDLLGTERCVSVVLCSYYNIDTIKDG